jgi:hypothetical protein
MPALLWRGRAPTTTAQAATPLDCLLLYPGRPSKYSAPKWTNSSRTCAEARSLKRLNLVRPCTILSIFSSNVPWLLRSRNRNTSLSTSEESLNFPSGKRTGNRQGRPTLDLVGVCTQPYHRPQVVVSPRDSDRALRSALRVKRRRLGRRRECGIA